MLNELLLSSIEIPHARINNLTLLQKFFIYDFIQ